MNNRSVGVRAGVRAPKAGNISDAAGDPPNRRVAGRSKLCGGRVSPPGESLPEHTLRGVVFAVFLNARKWYNEGLKKGRGSVLWQGNRPPIDMNAAPW